MTSPGPERKSYRNCLRGWSATASRRRDQIAIVTTFNSTIRPQSNQRVELPGANTFSRAGEEGNLLALHPTVKPVALIANAIMDRIGAQRFRTQQLPGAEWIRTLGSDSGTAGRQPAVMKPSSKVVVRKSRNGTAGSNPLRSTSQSAQSVALREFQSMERLELRRDGSPKASGLLRQYRDKALAWGSR